ncbi:hypothetical protein D9615_004217 [Tricholomella constricta]|uniref:Uncharacterized protein n=1 Tax=Tricholomella constricta TaxID=117010 RepID=A0A8H5HF65_9AGAR|nr:hypothetical protein D9615_004217 [Tricholomella constricta]
MVAQVSPLLNGVTGDTSAKANGKAIRSKNQLRRLKAKQKKTEASTNDTEEKPAQNKEHAVQPSNVVYVSEQLDVKGTPLEAFADVFARFRSASSR